MRPLRYAINMTIDGCCDHMAGVASEVIHRHATESLARADVLIFGRVIYEMMETAWRAPAESGVKADWMDDWMMPFARTIHEAKKVVVSDTLKKADWKADLVRGPDLAAAVEQLKRKPGKELLVAGVTLPLSLAKLGLIDEFEFLILPRIAGHGPTLLSGLAQHVDLKLVSQRHIGDGIIEARYTK